MIVASVLRNLLWALRYPSFPSDIVGEYSVGAIQTRIPTQDGPLCQIHYPTSTRDARNSQKVPYIRPKAVAGLAEYSRQPKEMMDFLSKRTHPCAMNAPPLVINKQQGDGDSSSSSSSFPIVIFSHGLGGCMEMYTSLCQQIASQGFCVVAVEHADGSGAYAETIKGDSIFYQRPDDSPYSRSKVVNFRRPFLRQRVEEIEKVLEYILETLDDDADDDGSSSLLLQQIFQAADRTQGIHLLGHSFGGATMALASQNERLRKDSFSLKSLSMLDCWAFSLDDPALEQGISLPTLSLLSEAWLTNPETAQIQELLQNSLSSTGNSGSSTVESYHIPDSVHASFSDATNWLPGVVTKKMGFRGPKEAKHATIRTAAQACVQHMRQQTITNDRLQEFRIEKKTICAIK